MELNPHHPGWYQFAPFFYHYDRGEYREALDASKKMNMPDFFWNSPKCGSNNYSLGTPLLFDSRKLSESPDLPVQTNRRIKRQVSIAADNLLRYHK